MLLCVAGDGAADGVSGQGWPGVTAECTHLHPGMRQPQGQQVGWNLNTVRAVAFHGTSSFELHASVVVMQAGLSMLAAFSQHRLCGVLKPVRTPHQVPTPMCWHLCWHL